MRSNRHKRRNKKGGNTYIPFTTTLAELFAAIQDEVLLSEDNVVIEVAAHLFLTGQVKYATR